MCFDIDVNKLSLPELRDTLRRITMVLSKPVVVNNLPDKGHQLRQVKENLIKEIKYRENLEETHLKMKKMSLKCASDTNIDTAHCTRLCSFDRRPERERFRPNLSVRPLASGRTESMKELHSGTKLIDLTMSLNIQKEQEERVKAEQLRAKQEKLLSFLKKHETDQSSEETVDCNLSDYSEDGDIFQQEHILVYSDDEPGPSGLSKIKKLKTEHYEEERKMDSDTDMTEELETMEPEKEVETNVNITEIKIEVDITEIKMEPEKQIEPNNDIDEVKVEAMEAENKSKNSNNQNGAKTEMKKNSEKSEEEFQLNAAISELIAEAIEQKESKYPKGQADRP